MASLSALPAPRPVLADLIPGARVRDAALVLTGALLMSGLAQVAIDVPPSPVPITGQTLGVGLIGATLGLRRGLLAILLYTVMGLFLPVYSEGAHGWDVIYSARGGYLVGFIFATALVGFLAERGASRKVVSVFGAFVVAQLVVFAFGLIGLKLAVGNDWAWTVQNGFVIFIFGGIVKAVIGALVLPGAWRAVRGLDHKN
ncbi:MAG: biotin transporter BioY [Solirubrobacteraceae bacterium]|nr:biotin transporter BioY [Solirubrobacteraceae bacterium]